MGEYNVRELLPFFLFSFFVLGDMRWIEKHLNTLRQSARRRSTNKNQAFAKQIAENWVSITGSVSHIRCPKWDESVERILTKRELRLIRYVEKKKGIATLLEIVNIGHGANTSNLVHSISLYLAHKIRSYEPKTTYFSDATAETVAECVRRLFNVTVSAQELVNTALRNA